MRTLKYLAFPLLTTGLLVGLAAPTHAQSSASKLQAKTDKIVLNITDTGTLWGTVTATYKANGKSVTKTCSAAKCSWHIADGAKLKLSQTPTNIQTWPFKDWEITKKGGSTKTVTTASTSLKLKGNYTIKVVYVVA